MARVQPFGGAPRHGDADGEPLPSPSTEEAVGYGGAPTYQGVINRGAKAVGVDGDGPVFPEVYGGGKGTINRGARKGGKAKGSGDKTGGGASGVGGSPS